MTNSPTASDLDRALHDLAAKAMVLIATDFDGVLAPIRRDRLAVRPLATTHRELVRLLDVPGVHVALISGRPLGELRTLAGMPDGAILIGSHGSEVTGAEFALTHQERTLQELLTRAALSVARIRPGAIVEEKPTGVAVHTRRCRRDVALAATADLVLVGARDQNVHVIVGKEVVELLVTHRTKGDAINRLRSTLDAHATLYLGDDHTDESVFAVMRPSDVSIKVGQGWTAARYRVDTLGQVARVFRTIRTARLAGPATGRPRLDPPVA